MPTLFTRIILGQLPGSFVYTDHLCAVFMTINPITTGHALVVPRAEVDQWTDLDSTTIGHLLHVSQRVGAAQKVVYGCERVGFVIAGFEIPHCHIHLIPTNSMSELSFENASPQVDQQILGVEAAKIREKLDIK